MGLIDELWEHSRQTHRTHLKPRPGYIIAGIVLAEPFEITKAELVTFEPDELDYFAEVLDRVTNVELDEIRDNVYKIYSTTPSITSLEE